MVLNVVGIPCAALCFALRDRWQAVLLLVFLNFSSAETIRATVAAPAGRSPVVEVVGISRTVVELSCSTRCCGARLAFLDGCDHELLSSRTLLMGGYSVADLILCVFQCGTVCS